MNPEYLLRMVDRADLRPYLSDEQFEFRRSMARVLQKHATPDYIRECDEHKRFPSELIATAVEQGWFALTIPEEYGGIGGYLDMASFLEVAAYHSIGLTRFWNVNVNMVSGALARFADDHIKSVLLPEMVQGQTWFAFALSENGSGSDAASLTTRAVEDGDDFVVDGSKMWITGATHAKYILTAVRTDKNAKKHEGISLLLIPTDTPGIEIRPIDMLGGGAVRTCEVNYVNVRVPKRWLVGELHLGWKRLTAVLAKERVALAAMCVGAAQAAVDLARWYALDRKQFGQPVFDFQSVSHLIADMQTQVDASRLLAYSAARLLADGKSCEAESSQAKYFASDAYVKIATDGVQVMGANGYSMEFAMQRHYREAKMFQIFGGTNQVQRNIVARSLKA